MISGALTTLNGRRLIGLVSLASLVLGASAPAAVILSSDFTGVAKNSGTGEANGFTWDTVDGITAPATSLEFTDPDDSSIVGFHNVTANEIDVDNNMNDGGWQTSFDLQLAPTTISLDLQSLILDLRLTNGSGSDNSTSSKSGQVSAELFGSLSGSLGTTDLGGNQPYPSVEYTRNLDLTSFPTLDPSETYTLELTATGTGFGHHKSLQSLTLEGTATIPEPSTSLLGALGLLALVLRRRR